MRRALALAATFLMGCLEVPPAESPVHVELGGAECEGLSPAACLVPWPSSRYLVPDATTETGYRVSIPVQAMPVNRAGAVVDPALLDGQDGFSPMSTLVTVLPAPIDASVLPSWTQPSASLSSDSRVVLIDAETGERVLCFAEIEEGEGADREHPTLYIRPAQRLAENRAYAVGIRSLVDRAGRLIAPSEAFRVLRDGVATDAEAIEARRSAFEDTVLEPLGKAGVERASLVQAWGFRTASGGAAHGDLVAMRDDALGGGEAWGCEVTGTARDAATPEVFRVVRGRITVPLYLDSEEGGARLSRGVDGRPVRNGTTTAPFVAVIPRSAAKKAASGGGGTRLVVYGHGLWSSAEDEVQRDFAVRFAEEHGAVLMATDLWGLAAADQAFVAGALPDLNGLPAVIDRVLQGVVNHLVLMRAAAGCDALPAFRDGGRPLVDVAGGGYWGNSQGANLGITFAALSPHVDRFALGVGGISYPIMMPRSIHWPALESLLASGYARRLDRDLLMAMSAAQWDRFEGATFAPHVLRDPLPGGRVKQVLFQVGRDDAQTPNVASFIAARTLGVPLLTPSAVAVDALATFAGEAASGAVIYDVGARPLPLGPVPPRADTPAHEGVRRDPRAQQQIDRFLRPGGRVVDTCGGPCGPLSARQP